MPMSNDRHPSRDAVMRDAFNQQREQHGLTLDEFAFRLNALVHALCPSKVSDQPALSSFSTVTAEATRAIGAWNKRVQRWANGDTEFPAWLEESWVAALEECGNTDQSTRIELARRHGYLGVKIPSPTDGVSPMCAFQANAQLHGEFGAATALIAKMLADGRLDQSDIGYAAKARQEIRDTMAVLTQLDSMIATQVQGVTVQ